MVSAIFAVAVVTGVTTRRQALLGGTATLAATTNVLKWRDIELAAVTTSPANQIANGAAIWIR